MTHLEFVNMTPRADFQKYANEQLERLLAVSPSDSIVQAKAFFTTVDSFVLEVSIHSAEGRFRAAAGVPVPRRNLKDRMWQRAAFDAVRDEVSKQLTRWSKARRFGKPT